MRSRPRPPSASVPRDLTEASRFPNRGGADSSWRGGSRHGFSGEIARGLFGCRASGVGPAVVPLEASSAIPLAALGATERVSEGFLRSQSTTMTEAPLRAISCPSASATVDFPSFGVAEVSPMTLLDLDLFSKSIANLIDRTPSENRDIGWSIAVQLIPRSPRTKALGVLSLGVFFASHPFRFLFWTFGRRPMQGIRKCD